MKIDKPMEGLVACFSCCASKIHSTEICAPFGNQTPVLQSCNLWPSHYTDRATTLDNKTSHSASKHAYTHTHIHM